MERNEATAVLLNLMTQPAFTVRDGLIDLTNAAAQKYFLEQGMPVEDLLYTGKSEYREFSEGCLYLSLSIAGIPCAASVRRMDGYDLFTIEQESDQAELQAIALAAQELRTPLSSVMTVADQLFPVAGQESDSATQAQIARINRGLFQMLRIVGNMSDAHRYSQQTETGMTMVDITSVIGEIFEKTAALLQHGGIELRFTNLDKAVYSLADEEKLERAIHNILSNAVKFSEKGSTILAKLTRRGDMLHLTVQDKGEGIRPELRGSVHNRFRRTPGLEESRYGIGLGMVLIRSAATMHGGTVLIDHPEEKGTRVTMTMAIQQRNDSQLRASTLRVDYAGERDHPLIELSEVLPAELYRTDGIN